MSKEPVLKSASSREEPASKKTKKKQPVRKQQAAKQSPDSKKKRAAIAKRKSAAPKPSSVEVDERLNLPKPVLAIYDEHIYTSRMLRLLEVEAENLLADADADLASTIDILHYITYFPDRYHHPREDLIFDRMSKVSAKLKQTIDRLRHDHEIMMEQSVDLYQRALEQQKTRSKSATISLAKEILVFSAAQREHMRLEEREVFVPAQRALNGVQWDEIESIIKPSNDPIFGDRVSSRYLTLLERYLNDFNSISNSGAVPIRRAEAVLVRSEKALHFVKKLSNQCGSIGNTSKDALKTQLSHIKSLADIRDLQGLNAWIDTEKEVNKENWGSIRSALDDVRKLFDKSVKSRRHTNKKFGPIEVKSSGKIQRLKEEPYKASGQTSVSWQAALTNLAFRLTLKPFLGRMDTGEGLGFPTSKLPAPVFPHNIEASEVVASDFTADWLIPKRRVKTRGTILYLPGGGFIFPAGNGHRTLLGKLAVQTQSRGMMVHYRLMPNYPFPAGLEDALAAYRYLLDEGTPPQEIVFAGDSAGGCLTLSLLMAIREEGLPMPAAAALISPVTDLTFSTAARKKNRWRDSSLPGVIKQNAYKDYASEAQLHDPLISPIFGSFQGLPPIFALVSSSETLLDDTLVVARKARLDGIDFEVEVWESLPHAWPVFPFIPEAGAATENVSKYFNHYLDLAERSALNAGKKAG